MALDWDKLHAGPIPVSEIKEAIKSKAWQEYREEMKGKSLEEKYRMLQKWLRDHNNSRRAKVQVTNYINALKRAGLI